mgnify:FL=1
MMLTMIAIALFEIASLIVAISSIRKSVAHRCGRVGELLILGDDLDYIVGSLDADLHKFGSRHRCEHLLLYVN